MEWIEYRIGKELRNQALQPFPVIIDDEPEILRDWGAHSGSQCVSSSGLAFFVEETVIYLPNALCLIHASHSKMFVEWIIFKNTQFT